MVVNSINFWIFFIAVLVLYYLAARRSGRLQNLVLLAASYLFYALVSWKMCVLLLASTAVYYGFGSLIAKYNESDEDRASWLTTLAVTLGIGLLFYFKYLGFFVEEFSKLLVTVGLKSNPTSFHIIMPLGISFFTFKLMGYAIEVHRENMDPCRHPVDFAAFVAFFPTIMSGPIDNPSKFLPQLESERRLDYANVSEGLRRILWGMFLKMCIADQLSGFTGSVLGNYGDQNAPTLLLAAVLYAFQLYTDFCGYSEMAIGVGQMMGIRIAENFCRPFFGQNISEFWRRWHMSLTSWITDYVFMPLNMLFRNMGKWGLLLATFLNLVIIGAWHGANWTYILFGVYHALLFVVVVLVDPTRKSFESKHHLKGHWCYVGARRLLTFVLVVVGMLLFQARNVHAFAGVLLAMGNGWGALNTEAVELETVIPFLLLVLLKEYKDENKLNIHLLHSSKAWVRVVAYYLLIFSILTCGNLNGGSFIYYQF